MTILRPKASSIESSSLELQQLLDLTETEDIDAFWNKINVMEGQDPEPLIEDMLEDEGYKKITFLYRSNKINQDVNLNGDDLYEYGRFLEEKNKFKQIPGTDIYYLQVNNIPAEATFEYNIQVNKTDLPTRALALSAITSNWRNIETKQIAEASINPPEELSDLVFGKRNIWIDEPIGFDSETGKVLFITDGRDFHRLLTPYISSLRNSDEYKNVLSNTKIVFVGTSACENRPEDEVKVPPRLMRVQEFYFDQVKFSELMANEIIPTYCPKKENAILVGHSLGGYSALDTALRHPDKIGAVILESAALNQTNRAATIDTLINPSNAQTNKVPIYMEIGILETVTPPIGHQGSVKQGGQELTAESRWEANNTVHANLKSAGYQVDEKLGQFFSGHNGLNIIGGIINGLRFIQVKQDELKDISNEEMANSTCGQSSNTKETFKLMKDSLSLMKQTDEEMEDDYNKDSLADDPKLGGPS